MGPFDLNGRNYNNFVLKKYLKEAKMIRYGISLLVFIFLMSGCATKDIREQKSKFIVIKTPEIKFADMGFVSTFDNRLNIQIYSSGEAVLSLDIYKDKICTSTFECMDKKKFNANFFNTTYYSNDTLENIFLAKPIFNGGSVKKTDRGFTQKIFLYERYDISYTVSNDDIIFIDKTNNVLIKVQNR
ncbi:MAG: hypothetical protein PHI79_01705 [Sulfurovaceae bacterium]|nr:hypothetical protein [Sulfurovaceae bacterium]